MLRAVSVNLAAPGPIGATTPGSIAATTITASNTITPDPVFGIVGSPTNNNAQTGSVGEYVSAVALYPGGAISVSTGTVSTITSITLTAGDWDVQASTNVIWLSSASYTQVNSGISRSPTSFESQGGSSVVSAGSIHAICSSAGTAPGNGSFAYGIAPVRVNTSATLTLYLNFFANFSGTTIAAFGTISARRAR